MLDTLSSFFNRHRAWSIAAFVVLSTSLAYAVFAPALGIRQNQADEEFQKGWLLFQDRKFDAAVEKFSQALRINPEFNWARRFLAEAYYFSGQKSDALDEYEALARAMPHDLTLKNHIDALTLSDDAPAEKPTEFLRVLDRTQGYRYNRPTYVGLINSDRFAVLSLGAFDVGNMVSYSAQGEPFENQHRVSGKLGYPMAFAQNENEVWITDFKEDKIHRMKKKPAQFFSYFFNPPALGKTGSAPLEFRAPAGLCHREGEFVVADSENNRLQRISDDGKFIAQITRPADVDAMQSPFGVWCNDEAIWTTEPTLARVTHFDRYGSIV
ncbi:MAG TPA: tetratricopeptide repeat protein, partial [Turneriella sp.]|nr:tetratricopeptide repeat protein [Turneriella sp.]